MDASGRLYRVSPIGDGECEAGFCVVPVEKGTELHRALRCRYGFTDREAEIALLLGRRATNREIADELGISMHTVRHHAGRVLEKAKLSSRVQVQSVISGMRHADARAPK